MEATSNNSWTEYSQYILMELKRLNKKLDSIEADIHCIKVDQKSTELLQKSTEMLVGEMLLLRNEQSELKTKVITLEVRAAIYGSVAGFIVTGIGLLISYVK